MNRDLEPLKQQYPDNFANYMDDVAIGTDNLPAGRSLYTEIVHKFLDTLALHSYFLKVSKCKFEKDEVKFLGFRLGNRSVRIDPSKVGLAPRTQISQESPPDPWCPQIPAGFHTGLFLACQTPTLAAQERGQI